MNQTSPAISAVHPLHDRHRQEWLDSKVNRDVISRNVETLTDAQQVAKLLNLPLTGQHGWGAQDLTPGWVCWGVNPKTGQRNGNFVYKPDNAPLALDENGKPQIKDGALKRCKYIQRRGQATSPLFLDAKWLPWPDILVDSNEGIALTEGVKKAGAVVSECIPAISIQGMWNSQVNWELKPELRMFCEGGRVFYLFPDADWRTNPQVAAGWLRTGALLGDAGASVRVCIWDDDLGKGIDDALANGADLEAITAKAIDLPRWQKQVKVIKDETPEITPQMVNKLLAETQAHFDIHQLIHAGIANAITLKAKSFALPPELLLVGLFTVCSSLITHKLDLGNDYIIPAILWVGFVGDSGTGKSPVLSTFTKPLGKLQTEAFLAYETALENWRLECETLDKGKQPPPAPSRRYYYLSDFTWEAIAPALKVRSHCLVYSDELAGFVNAQNQYKNGRGNDRQRWLTAYDGGAVDVLRVGKSHHIPDAILSILGGVQPSILLRLISGDGATVDGFWARFIWVEMPHRKSPCPLDMPSVELAPLLEGLYRVLDARASVSTIFTLCPQGKRLWRQWWDEIEALKDDELNPFLRAIYPKALERAGRIALVAHCVNCAHAKVEAGDVIQAETLEWAIAFVRWTLQQARAIYADCGHSESPEAQRIARFVQRFQGKEVNGKRVFAWWTGTKKPPMKECREFLTNLVSLGYAEVTTGTPDKPNFTVRILGKQVSFAQNPDYDGDTGLPTTGKPGGKQVSFSGDATNGLTCLPENLPSAGKPETPTGSQLQPMLTCLPGFSRHDSSTHPGEGWYWLEDATLPGGGEWVHESELED